MAGQLSLEARRALWRREMAESAPPCSWCGRDDIRRRPVHQNRRPTGWHVCDACAADGRHVLAPPPATTGGGQP